MPLRKATAATTGGGLAARVGATVAALNAAGTPTDGQAGVLRLGTWPNLSELGLVYNAAQAKWISEEIVACRQSDSSAMDIGNRSGTALLDWSQIVNSIPYGKSFTTLNGGHDLSAAAFTGGTGVLTVLNTASSLGLGPFLATGTVIVRDNIITYAAKTATTFTGCTVVAGSRGTVPSTVDVVQGYPGGFGMVPTVLPWVAETIAAGFTLQERSSALINAVPGGVQWDVAPYWTEAAAGDGQAALPLPLAGGVGLSALLASGASDGGAKATERSFFMRANDWTNVALTFTKRYALARPGGRARATAIDTGQVLDYRLGVRWIG